MKKSIYSLILLSLSVTSATVANEQQNNDLVNAFAEQHQQLMPKVAVADMYAGCLLAKQQTPPSMAELILKTDKKELADNLINCLGDSSLASDVALNSGIRACFLDQMSNLEADQRQQNMQQVEAAITQLPRAERQKSFTQCVNNQTLKYLSPTTP
ncbi:hypothetical protein [Thalassotalea maritima]|uniref:hypothetical protein n=1 Tax=Thalassotalea maritima TaxID=3242416 RepID=UPI0035272649